MRSPRHRSGNQETSLHGGWKRRAGSEVLTWSNYTASTLASGNGRKHRLHRNDCDRARVELFTFQPHRKSEFSRRLCTKVLASQRGRCEVSPRRVLYMADYRVNRGESQEDQFTAAIENTTSKVPSSAFLALALASMAVSATYQALSRKHESLFIGQWAAPFLLLGIYNKMVKQHGSDGRNSERNQGTQSNSEEFSSYRSPERSFSQTAGI